MNEDLPDGIYESIESKALESLVNQLTEASATFEKVPSELLAEELSQHVSVALRKALDKAGEGPDKIRLANEVLQLLDAQDQAVTSRGFELRSIQRANAPIVKIVRPTVRMGANSLITNSRNDPSVGVEIGAEIASADSIDSLISFVKLSGITVLDRQLEEAHDRGVPIRVLTTTYMGATERKAVDRLVQKYGAEVRISYDIQSTRLHAKAWLFHRNSGLNTAYIGSSNLSRYAMVDGLEWNVRISKSRDEHILNKMQATFDGYWNSGAFTPYDPETDGDTLERALRQSGSSSIDGGAINISGIEVSPRPHQQQILEALDSERQIHGHHHNLVVAATGTGKTVVAALDFKRLRDSLDNPSLLFVAHRKEILQQSMRMFREVLGDGNFGELFVDGERPEHWKHVFASIQGMSAKNLAKLHPERFNVIIVDEFHHAEADSYRRLLDHFSPKELLGLTATPERADGVNVASFFDGRVAAELRLWDALEQDLLVPFHYFGVADDVDLSRIMWTRGSYDVKGLEKLYTGNDGRAAKVIKELEDKVLDVHQMRALGFCVSIAHAQYMARVFNTAGIASIAVSAKSSARERADALQSLRDRTVNCVFAVDLFNEGLDIPQVDTVLFLRPTQSATVFLQQLGRGLRRSDNKAVLTVLDFVGFQRQEFRFDLKFRALTGTSRSGLIDQIEKGFPFLPSGCRIALDRVSQKIILDNVRTQVISTRRHLVDEIRSHGERQLEDFLRESGRDVADIYKSHTWTGLTRLAGFDTKGPGPGEVEILKRARFFAHVDDPERATAYAKLFHMDCPVYADLSLLDQTYARMLVYNVWPRLNGLSDYQDGLQKLRDNPAVCDEIGQLLEMQGDLARNMPRPLGGKLADVPLFSHATYKREELLAALGFANDVRPINHREGVAWCEPTNTDAFLVTLHKQSAAFTETTSYKDYALSPDLFHWESQSTTTREGKTGQRYLNHQALGTNVVLFARDTPGNDLGAGAAYVCLGTAQYVSDRGEKPIAITWKLDRPMPVDIYTSASAVAV